MELARRLDVSETTIRNRIAKLRDQGLKFRAELPRKEAQNLIYLVHSRPGARFALAQELRSHPAVTHLHVTNGSVDLVVLCGFNNEVDSVLFETEYLRRNSDVVSFEACSSITEVVGQNDVVPIAQDSTLPMPNEKQIARSLILMPRFRDQSEALHWLASFLRRAHAADHVMISTQLEMIGFPRGPLLPYVAGLNIPDKYIRATSKLVESEDSEALQRLPITITLRTRKHVFVPDVMTSELFQPIRDFIPEIGHTSFISFPMSYGSELVGVAALYFDKCPRVDEDYLSSVQRSLDFFTVTLLHSLESSEPSDHDPHLAEPA